MLKPKPSQTPTQSAAAEEAVKYDTEKVRYELISPLALDMLAQVYTMGAKKYGDNNWRKGMAWSRIFGALMRHAWAWMRGEDIDQESGLPHMAHAMWCCATLLDYMWTVPESDDRVKTPGSTALTSTMPQS